MAVKTYRALQKGQAPNGAIVEDGEVFSAEFRVIVREDKKDANGKVIARPAARNDDGSIKTAVAKEPPSWAEEVKGDTKKPDKSDAASD